MKKEIYNLKKENEILKRYKDEGIMEHEQKLFLKFSECLLREDRNEAVIYLKSFLSVIGIQKKTSEELIHKIIGEKKSSGFSLFK